MRENIRAKALALGFDACRFTSASAPATSERFRAWLQQQRHGDMAYLERNAWKRVDPQAVLASAKTIICLATNYFPPEGPASKTASGRGVVARYARFRDYHNILAPRLKALSQFVNEIGLPPIKSLWYVDTGPLLERDFAQRAGIGFIGKHTNVISRQHGNWIFLSEIITTLELPADEPEKNHCGKCHRCLDACPTGAITAPFELDARRCISYLTIELKGAIPEALRPAIGRRIYGCDDCLEACPWNRFAREARSMRGESRPDLASPDLLELLSLDEAGFKNRFAGTPMLRTKRRGLLRNVAVALGNTAGPEALAPLRKAAEDPEPLIAEHARWAIDRIAARTGGEPSEPWQTVSTGFPFISD